MNHLIFQDTCANHAVYALAVPDTMATWRMGAFLEFMSMGSDAVAAEGFLVEPVCPLRHESFRQLVSAPASTLNRPVSFVQNDRILTPDDEIVLSHSENVIYLERCESPEVIDNNEVDVSHRNRMVFESTRDVLIGLMDRVLDLPEIEIMTLRGRPAQSIAELLPDVATVLDEQQQLRLLHRIASCVHATPFENFSRILDGVELRSGYEMWAAMAGGFGGVCVEKTAAVRFACDILGLETVPVIGSNSSIPSDIEERILCYVASEGAEELPIWIQHHLLEVCVAERRYLVDATNGNMPLVVADETYTEQLLQSGMLARMVYNVDRVKLRRVGQRTGDLLLTIGEFQVPDLQLQYIFEQGLGLHISDRAFLGVYFDWGGERSRLQQNYYMKLARQREYLMPRFIHSENLTSVPDESLRELITHLLKVLRERYDDPVYTGDFTFVLQPLSPNFWMRPRLGKPISEAMEYGES